MTALNIDDTSRCPLAKTCESCQASPSTLEIATISTEIGVYCLTICAACVNANRLPALDWPTAAELIGRHCQHLGCDLDQMAVALAGGSSEHRP